MDRSEALFRSPDCRRYRAAVWHCLRPVEKLKESVEHLHVEFIPRLAKRPELTKSADPQNPLSTETSNG